MELFIWLGPITIIYCAYKAIKGTKVTRTDEMTRADERVLEKGLLGAANSIAKMNGDDSYGVK
jgi:hypothetical protein